MAETDQARLPAAGARRVVGLVPPTAGDLLYLEHVADECAAADRESAACSTDPMPLSSSLASCPS